MFGLFQPGPAENALYTLRRLEAFNIGFKNKRDHVLAV